MSRVLILFLVFDTLGLAILLTALGLATLQSNLVGWFLSILGIVYFLGVVIVYWFRRIEFWRPRAQGEFVRQERSDRSFWFIVVGMIAAFYLPPIEYLLFEAVLPRAFFMQILGLLFIVLGSVLFVWARRTLGRFYSGHVSVIDGQQLVQSGPYRFIRHPAYAGYLLMALGLAVGYSSLGGTAALISLLLPAVIYRIRVEDRLLAEHFGAQFSKYASRTKHLVPGIW